MSYDTKAVLQNVPSLFFYVLILVTTSEILQLMEWLEKQNIKYLENRA